MSFAFGEPFTCVDPNAHQDGNAPRCLCNAGFVCAGGDTRLGCITGCVKVANVPGPNIAGAAAKIACLKAGLSWDVSTETCVDPSKIPAPVPVPPGAQPGEQPGPVLVDAPQDAPAPPSSDITKWLVFGLTAVVAFGGARLFMESR